MFKAICSTQAPSSSSVATIAQLTMPVSFALAGSTLSARAGAAMAEANPNTIDGDRDGWEMRVDMTLADAEDLVAGLRSLIAAAKQSSSTVQPTALALAGLKIGGETTVAPPRFSNAQLDALSRLPIRRGLNLGGDGRIVHALTTPASLHASAR